MLTLENVSSIFEISPNAYVVLLPDSPKFTIVAANEAFLNAVNPVSRNIIGKGIFEAFPENPSHRNFKGMKAIKAALEYTRILKKQHKISLQRYDLETSESAEPRFWNADTFPLLDKNNEVQFIVQHLANITDRVNQYKQNTVSDKQLTDDQHPLFNNFPDAVCSLDLKGNFLSANKVLLDFAACTKNELLNRSFISLIAPEDFERVFGYFQKAIQGKVQNFDARVVSANGNSRMVNISSLPISDNTDIIGVYTVAKDITAWAAQEQELQIRRKQIEESNKKITNILASITDGFYAVDRNWEVTYWNKEAERLTGVPRQDIIGRNLWEIFAVSVPTKFFTELHKAMSQNISVRFEEYSVVVESPLEVTAFPSDDGLSIHFKDISARKHAEQQLYQERERYRTLFDLSPLAKWVYDVDTLQFLDVNAAAIKLYGYSRKEFLSMNLKNIRPKEDLENSEEISTRLQSDLPDNSSVRHITKQGRVIFVNVSSRSIKWEGKNVRLVLAIDNTEKLKAEQQLEASEQRFRALVQEGSDLIAIMDTAGNYLYVSPTSKPILGIEASYFIGKSAFDFIHEDDKALVIEKFTELEFKKRIKIAAFRFMDGNRKFRWIETVITDMTDDVAIGGVVANSRDVTQRIENEIKIKESIERYNTVSKATSDAIWDLDLVSGITFWNKGIKGIFGYKQYSFPQDWWFGKVHPEDLERLVRQIEMLIKKKKSRLKNEYRFRCADGSYKHVLDRAFIIFNKAGEPVRMIGAMQDITDRVNYTREVEEQNKRLHEIAWAQSHIVRTPVARIMGLADLLSYNEDAAEQKKLLLYLKNSANELDDIVRNIAKKTEGL